MTGFDVTIKLNTMIRFCPLCESQNWKEFARHDQHLRYDICLDCGLVFQNPRMSMDEQTDWYRGGRYMKTVYASDWPTEGKCRIEWVRARRQAEFLRPFVEKTGVDAHLDIGCSLGYLLSAVKDRYHPQVSGGIEPAPPLRLGAQQRDPEFRLIEDLTNLTPKRQFDLITMSHVLEHLDSPVEYLRVLRDFAKPYAVLMVSVPNIYFHGAFEPAHLTAFSPTTLRATLMHAGWNVIKVAPSVGWQVDPFWRLLPPYNIRIVATPGRARGQFPRDFHVKLKRRLGMRWSRVIGHIRQPLNMRFTA